MRENIDHYLIPTQPHKMTMRFTLIHTPTSHTFFDTNTLYPNFVVTNRKKKRKKENNFTIIIPIKMNRTWRG